MSTHLKSPLASLPNKRYGVHGTRGNRGIRALTHIILSTRSKHFPISFYLVYYYPSEESYPTCYDERIFPLANSGQSN